MKKRVLSASDIIDAQIDSVWQPTPEWGGKDAGVFIRGMTGAERETFEEDVQKYRDEGQSIKAVRARLVATCAVDEDGNRIFTDDHIDTLNAKSAAVLDRLFDAVLSMSGIAPGDQERLAKN